MFRHHHQTTRRASCLGQCLHVSCMQLLQFVVQMFEEVRICSKNMTVAACNPCCLCASAASSRHVPGCMAHHICLPQSAFQKKVAQMQWPRLRCSGPGGKLQVDCAPLNCTLSTGEERWKARAYAAAVVTLAFFTTLFLVRISYAQRDFSTGVFTDFSC